jgi:hypothetical protein
MQHPLRADFGELALVGYDAHELGFAHEPARSLQPGDVLHLNLYWRAEAQPSGAWAVDIAVIDRDGREWAGLRAEPVGNYGTDLWQEGDVWRGQFNIPLPADLPTGRYRLRVQPISPGGASPGEFLSEPLNVGQ